MKFLFFNVLLAALPLWSDAKSSAPESSPVASIQEPIFHWNKSCNDNGLTIYWSKVEGSQVIAFRGEGIIDAPIEKVASIIIDTTRATEWVDSLVSSKMVRDVSPVEFIEYDHAGIPFPFTAVMSDRDFVSRVTVESDPKTPRLMVNYNPAEDNLAPLTRKCVRGVMTCVFKMVPMTLGDETYVEAEVHCDPKGGVPKWLVNFFQQGWPQTTFENLRRQVKKPDIQILPVVESLLRKSPVKLVQSNKK